MKLRSKLAYSNLVIALIIMVGMSSMMIYWEHSLLEKEVENYFRSQSNQLTREFKQFAAERSGDVNVLSTQILHLGSLSKAKEVEELLYTTRDSYRIYQNLYILDENRIKLFDTNRINLKEKNLFPFFNQAKNTKDIQYDFYFDQDTNLDMLAFYRAIYDRANNFKGVLILNVPTSSIALFTRSNVGSHVGNFKKNIEILRTNGEIIYSSYRDFKSDEVLVNTIKEKVTDNEKSYFSEYDDEYLYFSKETFHLLNGNRQTFYYVFKTTEEDINGQMYSLIVWNIIFFVIILTIAISIAYYIAKNISRPIEESIEAIRKVGDGDFESIQKVKSSKDEYGILVNQLKTMAKELGYMIDENSKKSRMETLGEMAGGVAHEINNPLQLIYSHAHLLKRLINEKNCDLVKAEKSIRVISETVERISKIIKGLKSLSREGSADPFIETNIDIILDATLTISHEKLKTNNVILQIMKSEEEINLDCRHVQISQVILNLINNAFEAVKNLDNKWIRIEVEKTTSDVYFKVINSGPKISSEIVQKLFTPFYTTKAAGIGTGLGLSISLNIAQSHGGTIYVDMSCENTCFVVQLPRSQNTTTMEDAA